MKFLIALAALIVIAAAAPPASPESQATIVSQQADIEPSGNYQNSVATSNGIQAQEQGSLKQVPGAETPSISVSGSFQYPGPDGQLITVNYIADEEGFKPSGAHLPVAPVA